VKPRIVKLRSGFLAGTVPGSETLDRDGNMFLPQLAHGNCGDWSCPTCNPRIQWYADFDANQSVAEPRRTFLEDEDWWVRE